MIVGIGQITIACINDGADFSFNILRKTNQGKYDWRDRHGTSGASSTLEDFVEGSVNGVKMTRNNVAVTSWRYTEFGAIGFKPTDIEDDTDYTISFELKPSVKCSSVDVNIMCGNATLNLFATTLEYERVAEANVWNKIRFVKHTKTGVARNGQIIYFTGFPNGVNEWFIIRNLKIEKGVNKNPSWSPHPEDIEGADGADGADGKDGKGIKSVVNKYQVNASSTTPPTTWVDTPPSMTTTNKYLWNYEIITYTDNSTTETAKRVIGVYGATGVGISSIEEYYLASASNSGVTTSTSGWTTAIQSITASKRYLWNHEKVNYTNGSTYISTPVIIGVFGDKGETGNKGDKGDKGDDGTDGANFSWNILSGQSSEWSAWWKPSDIQNSCKDVPNSTFIPDEDGEYTMMMEVEWRNIMTAVEGKTPSWWLQNPVNNVWTGEYGNAITSGKPTIRTSDGRQLIVLTNTLKGGYSQKIGFRADYCGGHAESGIRWRCVKVEKGRVANPFFSKSEDEYNGEDAKVVRITGESQFRYTNNFSGNPTPTSITLTATLQGTTGYDWSYKTQGSTSFATLSGTGSTQAIAASDTTLFPNNARSVVIRCTSGGVYDEITITKVSDGAKGDKGDTGRAVKSITEEYYVSTSKTSLTGGSWSTTAPTWTSGKYIWTRSKIVYTESNGTETTEYTTAVCDSSWEAVNELEYVGRNLFIGSAGKFKWGAYQGGTFTTEVVEDTTMPSKSANKLTWSVVPDNFQGAYFSYYNYKDCGLQIGDNATFSVYVKASRNLGAATGHIEFFSGTYTNTIRPNFTTEWQRIVLSGVVKRDITTGSGAAFTFYGLKLQAGDYLMFSSPKLEKGTRATDWTPAIEDGILSVDVEYALSSSRTTAPTGGWQTTAPTPSSTQYVWQRTKITLMDGKTFVYRPNASGVCIAGAKGDKGDTGKGVVSVTTYFMVSDKSEGVTNTDSGWGTGYLPPTAEKPYLWSYMQTNYTEGNPTKTTPQIIGRFSETFVWNLLCQNTITRGKYMTSTNGQNADTNWFCSDYIPVKANTKYITSGYTNLGSAPSTCFYNSSKGFISGINNANSVGAATAETIKKDKCRLVTTPANTAFMRVSGMIRDLSTFKVEQGEVATPWTPSKDDTKGDAAWTITATPMSLSINTNSNGQVDVTTIPNIKVTAKYGNENTTVTYDSAPKDLVNCNAVLQSQSAGVKISQINSSGVVIPYTDANGQEGTYTMPCTDGSLTITGTAKYDDNHSTTFSVIVPFRVSVSKQFSLFAQTEKYLKSQYTKLNTEQGAIKQNVSNLEQTAEEIKFSVRESMIGGNNLLPDSDFLEALQDKSTRPNYTDKDGKVLRVIPASSIVNPYNNTSYSYNGHSTLRLVGAADTFTTLQYQNLALRPNTTYRFALMARLYSGTYNPSTTYFIMQVVDGSTSLVQLDPSSISTNAPFKDAPLVNTEWRRFHVTFTTGSSVGNVVIKAYCKGAFNVWIAEPLLTEGEVEKPWDIGSLRTSYSYLDLSSTTADLAVTKNGMEKAGLHLDGKNSELRAVADHFRIQNTKGEDTITVDSNGNLRGQGNASFIGKVISGATNGQRVEMDAENKNVAVYDENGNQITVLEGNKRTRDSLIPTGVLGSWTYSGKITKTYQGDGGGDSFLVLAQSSAKVTSPMTLNITLSNITLRTQWAKSSLSIYLTLYKDSAHTEWYERTCLYEENGVDGTNVSITSLSKRMTIDKGYPVIEMDASHTWWDDYDSPHVTRVSAQVGSVVKESTFYNARMFANGYAMTTNQDNYFMPIEENGVINLYMKSNGITYQVINGSLYSQGAPQPRLIYRGTYWNYNSSVSPINVAKTAQGDVTVAMSQKVGAGRYRFKISNHGYTAYESNIMIHVSHYRGFHPNSDDMTSYSAAPNVDLVGFDSASQTFMVLVTNQSGAYTDGNVQIEIYRLGSDANIPLAVSDEEL